MTDNYKLKLYKNNHNITPKEIELLIYIISYKNVFTDNKLLIFFIFLVKERFDLGINSFLFKSSILMARLTNSSELLTRHTYISFVPEKLFIAMNFQILYSPRQKVELDYLKLSR